MNVPPSDPAPRFVQTPEGPVALVEEGDGTALVCVHGVPGSHRDFRHLAPRVTPFARMVRVDLPGMGQTPAPEGYDGSLEARAAAVRGAVDALGIERFALLGHSMGGAVAVAAADAMPARVTHLVLVASVGPRRHRGMQGMYPWMLDAAALALTVPGLRERLVPSLRERWRRARFPGTERMSAADLRLQLRLAARMDFAAHARRLARVRVPTLVAWAEDDHLVEPAVSAALAAAVPGATRLVFDEGGHNLQKTRATEIAAAVRELLGR